MWKMFPYQWLLKVEFHLEPFKLSVRFKIRFMVFSFLEIIPFRTSSIASNYKLLGWIFARILSFALVVKQSFYFCGSNKVESLLFQAPKANERTYRMNQYRSSFWKAKIWFLMEISCKRRIENLIPSLIEWIKKECFASVECEHFISIFVIQIELFSALFHPKYLQWC